ncbi:MAG: PEGA domain-containing protein [Myxococcota bacterium]
MQRILILCVAFTALGCASATVIRTDPPGVRLYIDGTPVGVTPTRYSDRRTVFSPMKVRLEKEGLTPIETELRRRKFTASTIPRAILLIGIPWLLDYDDEYVFFLDKPESGTPGNQASPPESP